MWVGRKPESGTCEDRWAQGKECRYGRLSLLFHWSSTMSRLRDKWIRSSVRTLKIVSGLFPASAGDSGHLDSSVFVLRESLP